MKMIWYVTVTNEDGERHFLAGVETGPEAVAMAERMGFDDCAIHAKHVINRFGVQEGDFLPFPKTRAVGPA